MAILVAVCAVAAHQATYVLGFRGGGFGRSMASGGHDGYWAPLASLILLAGMLLAFAALRQLRRLSARASHLDGGSHPDRELRAFLWSTLRLWSRLGSATVIVYVVQENLEHVLVGLAPSGLDALAAHGLLPIVVVAVTSLSVAVVAALVRWRCEALLARLVTYAARPRRRVMPSARPSLSTRMPRATVPAARGSRAPPAVAMTV